MADSLASAREEAEKGREHELKLMQLVMNAAEPTHQVYHSQQDHHLQWKPVHHMQNTMQKHSNVDGQAEQQTYQGPLSNNLSVIEMI